MRLAIVRIKKTRRRQRGAIEDIPVKEDKISENCGESGLLVVFDDEL